MHRGKAHISWLQEGRNVSGNILSLGPTQVSKSPIGLINNLQTLTALKSPLPWLSSSTTWDSCSRDRKRVSFSLFLPPTDPITRMGTIKGRKDTLRWDRCNPAEAPGAVTVPHVGGAMGGSHWHPHWDLRDRHSPDLQACYLLLRVGQGG